MIRFNRLCEHVITEGYYAVGYYQEFIISIMNSCYYDHVIRINHTATDSDYNTYYVSIAISIVSIILMLPIDLCLVSLLFIAVINPYCFL